MPKINIPAGIEITQTEELEKNTIKIRVPKTKFWVLGEKQPDNLWNIYLIDPFTHYKEIIKRNKTTASFALFCNVILKTPFPYEGKNSENCTEVKKFIKKITKIKKHGK